MQRPAKPRTSVRFRAQPPRQPRRIPPSAARPTTQADCAAFAIAAAHGPIAHSRQTPRPGGEIGRRKGLKIPRLRLCGFESRPGHHPPSGGLMSEQDPLRAAHPSHRRCGRRRSRVEACSCDFVARALGDSIALNGRDWRIVRVFAFGDTHEPPDPGKRRIHRRGLPTQRLCRPSAVAVELGRSTLRAHGPGARIRALGSRYRPRAATYSTLWERPIRVLCGLRRARDLDPEHRPKASTGDLSDGVATCFGQITRSL
jgi:hypothetical protein